MNANTRTSTAERAGRVPSAADLGRLVKCVRGADRLLAEAAALAGELSGSGVCEEVEGLPLEQFVGLAGRMTHRDARMLVTAGQVLEGMPVVRTLFEGGQLGWGQVRAIVLECARLSRADRATVDGRVAATVAAHEPGAAAFDPDGLVWAVEAAVDELRPAAVERAERRAVEESFLARQMDLDGGMLVHGRFAPVMAATVNNAIDGMMGRPPAGSGQSGHEPGDEDPGVSGGDGEGASAGETASAAWAASEDEGQGAARDAEGAPGGGTAAPGVVVGRWSSTPVGRAAARALADVCSEWLGGGSGRRARPLIVARVDLSQVSASPSGTVELNLRGPLPRIGAATLERLACDADLKAVLFDGERPLAVSKQVNLKDVSRKTRLAVETRDGGDRWPGSPDPIGFTDLDHIFERARGGNHHPDWLVALSRRSHRIRHKYRWKLALDPATGMLTIARGRRRFHSMPKGTSLLPAPERPPPPGQRARARAPGRQRPPPQGAARAL